MKTKLSFSLVSLCVLFIFSCKKEDKKVDKNEPQPATALFYCKAGDTLIGKVDLKNGNISSVFAKGIASGLSTELSILALNPENGDIYGTDEETAGSIYRISSNGIATKLYSGPTFVKRPKGIAYNSTNNKIYWASSSERRMYAAAADGTGTPMQLFIGVNVDADYGLVLDEKNGKLYFSDFNDIYVANLDGTGTPTILYSNKADTIESPSALALDVDKNKIYWTDEVADVVASANLNGTGNFKILFNRNTHDIDRSDGLALDLVAGKIYWSETASSTARIRVGNIDGTGTPVTLVSGVESYSLILK